MSDQEKYNPQHSDRQKPAPTGQKPIIQSNQPVQQKPPVPIAQPTGEVNSEDKRTRAEKVATGVPNVAQVVNNLQVKNQKASSSQ